MSKYPEGFDYDEELTEIKNNIAKDEDSYARILTNISTKE
jgi:hypothetical protein